MAPLCIEGQFEIPRLKLPGLISQVKSGSSSPEASTPSSMRSSPSAPSSPKIPARTTTSRRDQPSILSQAASKVAQFRVAAQTEVGDDVAMSAVGIARGQLVELAEELQKLRLESNRKQRLLETRVSDCECEARMAGSEAEAYKIAAAARGTAITTLQGTVDGLLDERSRLETRLLELQATASELHQAKSQRQVLLIEQRRATSLSTTNVRQLAAKVSDIEIAQQCAARAMHAAKELVQTTQSLKEELACSHSLIHEMEQNRGELMQRLSLSLAEQDRLQEIANRVPDLVAQLESAKAESQGLNQERDSLHRQLGAARNEAATAAEQLADACQHNAQLSSAAANLQRMNETTSIAVLSAQRERDELQRLVECLTTENADLRKFDPAAAAHEIAGLQAKVSELKASNKLLLNRAEMAESASNSSDNELKSLRNEARSLHAQLAEVIKALQAGGDMPQLLMKSSNLTTHFNRDRDNVLADKARYRDTRQRYKSVKNVKNAESLTAAVLADLRLSDSSSDAESDQAYS